MKVYLRRAGHSQVLLTINPGDIWLYVPGVPCPRCDAVPLAVRCFVVEHQDDQGQRGPAKCWDCSRDVGELAVEWETLFGAEEDEAVLNGRARVYGS